MRQLLILVLTLVAGAAAQTRPPIVLMNGYQGTCNANSPSSDVFGQMQKLLEAQGLTVYYFNNCTVPTTSSGRPTIEQIAQAFASFIGNLNVPQVDVVAHSMGGLILRTYIAGLQPSGAFNPPVQTGIRKAVLMAAPNYGALALAFWFANPPVDAQLNELLPASVFEWLLNTGNQGSYDFRGVDTIAVVGNNAQSSDGVVPLTSASLAGFFGLDRTQVIPACHIPDMPNFVCSGPGIAYVNSSTHPGYLIVNSFLAGTNDWQSVGHSAAKDPVLSANGGVDVAVADSSGNISKTTSTVKASQGPLLGNSSTGVFFGDLMPAGTYNFTIAGAGSGLPTAVSLQPPIGYHQPFVVKPGPRVDSIQSATGGLRTLSRAPGMLVSIYGASLDGASVTVGRQPASILFNSSSQINAVLPDSLSGVVTLAVTSAAGSHSVNLFIEPAVPGIFSADGSGTGPALALCADGSIIDAANSPAPGETVSFFATGLGLEPGDMPSVTIGGVAANLANASEPVNGVIRLDVTIPARASSTVPLLLTAGGRISNMVTLTIGAQ
jgi:uncharacterized protein (TIGR03437 family)